MRVCQITNERPTTTHALSFVCSSPKHHERQQRMQHFTPAVDFCLLTRRGRVNRATLACPLLPPPPPRGKAGAARSSLDAGAARQRPGRVDRAGNSRVRKGCDGVRHVVGVHSGRVWRVRRRPERRHLCLRALSGVSRVKIILVARRSSRSRGMAITVAGFV